MLTPGKAGILITVSTKVKTGKFGTDVLLGNRLFARLILKLVIKTTENGFI